MRQPWREQGNVFTDSFLFAAVVFIDLAPSGVWSADACEVRGPEHLTEPTGGSSRRFSCSCLVVLTMV